MEIVFLCRMLKITVFMPVLSMLFQIIGECGSSVIYSNAPEIQLPVLAAISISSALVTPFFAYIARCNDNRYREQQSPTSNVRRQGMYDACVFFIMLSVYMAVNISSCAMTFSADTIKKSVINQCIGFSVFSVLFVSLHMLFSHVFNISLFERMSSFFSMRGSNGTAFRPNSEATAYNL